MIYKSYVEKLEFPSLAPLAGNDRRKEGARREMTEKRNARLKISTQESSTKNGPKNSSDRFLYCFF